MYCIAFIRFVGSPADNSTIVIFSFTYFLFITVTNRLFCWQDFLRVKHDGRFVVGKAYVIEMKKTLESRNSGLNLSSFSATLWSPEQRSHADRRIVSQSVQFAIRFSKQIQLSYESVHAQPTQLVFAGLYRMRALVSGLVWLPNHF